MEKEYSNPVLIDLKNATSFNKDVSISLPTGVVAGSPRIVVTAIGQYRLLQMSLRMRKPTIFVFDQVPHKRVCIVTKAG